MYTIFFFFVIYFLTTEIDFFNPLDVYDLVVSLFIIYSLTFNYDMFVHILSVESAARTSGKRTALPAVADTVVGHTHSYILTHTYTNTRIYTLFEGVLQRDALIDVTSCVYVCVICVVLHRGKGNATAVAAFGFRTKDVA